MDGPDGSVLSAEALTAADLGVLRGLANAAKWEAYRAWLVELGADALAGRAESEQARRARQRHGRAVDLAERVQEQHAAVAHVERRVAEDDSAPIEADENRREWWWTVMKAGSRPCQGCGADVAGAVAAYRAVDRQVLCEECVGAMPDVDPRESRRSRAHREEAAAGGG